MLHRLHKNVLLLMKETAGHLPFIHTAFSTHWRFINTIDFSSLNWGVCVCFTSKWQQIPGAVGPWLSPIFCPCQGAFEEELINKALWLLEPRGSAWVSSLSFAEGLGDGEKWQPWSAQRGPRIISGSVDRVSQCWEEPHPSLSMPDQSTSNFWWVL